MGIVGRVDERARIGRAHRGAADASSVVVVTGEAGIGKTALFESLVGDARSAGASVLVSRPARAEESFSYSALGDLVAGVPEAAFAALSAPARTALDIALRRVDDPGHDLDAGAVAFAAAGLLSALTLPVVVAIDDVQWVDAPSAAVIDYVVRRMPAAGTLVVACWRTGEPSHCTFASRPGDAVRVDTIELGPVGIAELHHIIRDHAGLVPTRPALVRIAELSAGNPLFAIELARHDAARSTGDPGSLPATLRDSLRERLDGLSDATRHTLLAVAALGRPTFAQVRAVVALDDLAEAERDGTIVVRDGRVEFSHPLLAAELYGSATVADRIAMHQRLAVASTDPEVRGHHLARATSAPDATIAAEVDVAVAAAAARGAPHAAAELAEAAVDLTPPDDPERARRELALAEHRFQAGDASAARAGLEAALATIDDAALRTRALLLLAEITYEADTPPVAIAYAQRALDAAPTTALRAEAHITLARVCYDDFDRAHEHAQAARTILEGERELPAEIVAAAELTTAMTAFLAGLGFDRDGYERAAALEALSTRQPRLADSARAALASDLKYADHLDDARGALVALYEESLDSGDESSRPFALSHLPQLELYTGRWDAAEAWATEHLLLAEATRQQAQIVQARFNLAIVAAHRGDVGPARTHALADLDEATAAGDRWTIASVTALLGFLAWSEGDAAAALPYFTTSWEQRETMGLREPGRSRFLGDHIEVLIALDHVGEAQELIDVVSARARAVGRPSGINASERGRGLLLARAGEHDASQQAFAAALDALDGVPLPFERARTLLASGQALRRAKAKRAARDALELARREFEQLGALSWAARTTAELARAGGRPSAPLELTDTERRVAELAATGATTKAIAAAAFISAKTVEANLTRIYRKLGVSSRAELAARMAETRPG